MAETTRQPMMGPEPVGGPSPPAKNGSTMIVGCRIPHGLVLRTFDIVEAFESTRDGVEKVQKAQLRQQAEASFVVRGPGRGTLTGLTQDQLETLLPGGFALTQGCPTQVWNDWLSDNRNSPYVTRNDVFAETSMERARNRAIDLSRDPDAATGLDPIDPENPGRRVRGERGLRLARGDASSGA
jgi:hypothetical protein